VSVHGNTRGAHFKVKCGALRTCLALLWWNFRIDVDSILLNLSSGLNTAWLNRWTMHLTSWTFSRCDIETYPLLCSRIKPACILQQTLYAARLVFWPPVQDTIIVWLCLALEDNEQCVLRLILPYKRLWWWPLRSVICQYPFAESKPHEPLCKVAKRHMPTSLLFSPRCRWLLPLHSFYFTLSRVCRWHAVPSLSSVLFKKRVQWQHPLTVTQAFTKSG